MTIKQANEIDSAYEKQYDEFNKQHDFLKTVFGRTPLEDDLDTLMDKVSDARWLNVKAGWLSDTSDKFDRLDYFDTIGSQPSDYELSPYEEKCLLPLVENLERLWSKHKAVGFGLMCMASHSGDTDYDLSLTQALMFD